MELKIASFVTILSSRGHERVSSSKEEVLMGAELVVQCSGFLSVSRVEGFGG